MYNIGKLKKQMPFLIDNLEIRLLDYKDIDWYINTAKQDFFNEFIDNKFTDTPYEVLKFRLTNLVMSYRTGVKVQGEARLVIIDSQTGNKIGGCTLFEKDNHTIEVGYWIVPAYQGKGNAKKLIYNIDKLIFNLKNIDTINLTIREDNNKSLIIADKCGYKNIGSIKGKYKNNIIYELKDRKNEKC